MSQSNHEKISKWVNETFKPGTVIILHDFNKMDMDLGAEQEYQSLVGKQGIVSQTGSTSIQVDFGDGHERVPLIPIADKIEIVSTPAEPKKIKKKRRVGDNGKGETYYYHTSDT